MAEALEVVAHNPHGNKSAHQKQKPLRDDQYLGPFADPVYKQIAQHNGHINRMSKEELQNKLRHLGLDTRGVKEVLKKRLKNHYKKLKLKKAHIAPSAEEEQKFDYLLVIDFEATCEEYNPHNYDYEIIEFPVVLIDVEEKKVVSEFHEYVRPVKNPKLSDFCVTLTGIQQETVDKAAMFPDVLDRMEAWMAEQNLGKQNKIVVVTDGPWDMSRFMHLQCATSCLPFPNWAKKWINIRKSYSNYYGFKRVKLSVMLENLGMEFEGQQHSGIDDARNIARIVLHMLNDGFVMRVNERLYPKKDKINRNIRTVPKNDTEGNENDECSLEYVCDSQQECTDGGQLRGQGCDMVGATAQLEQMTLRSRSPSPDEGHDDLLFYYSLQK